MKETIIILYWLFAIALAWVQGGFGWVVLNLFLPIAPMFLLIEKYII